MAQSIGSGRRAAFQITTIYVLAGAAYMVFSDWVPIDLSRGPSGSVGSGNTLIPPHAVNGLIFVITTSLALLWVLHRAFAARDNAIARVE